MYPTHEGKKVNKISPHLYSLKDTCNVYLIKEGERALLIDAGSGTVLEEIEELGIRKVEWVLHTHHHRDQCWGDPKLVASGTRVGVPQHERHLFERAELFWQTRRIYDNYNDRNTFFAIGNDIPVTATLDDYEIFEWRGYRFFVLPAKGHTLGSVALVVEIDERLIVFTGDLIAQGGLLYQLHALEYTYGDMVGALFTLQSIQALRTCLQGEVIAGQSFPRQSHSNSPLLLPSHGDPIDHPLGDIRKLGNRLMDLVDLGQGLRIGGRDSISEAHYLPISKFVSLSEHLLWGGPWTCSNFYVLLSRSGKAMFIDYGHAYLPHMHIFSDHDGLETMRFVEHHLNQLRDQYGVKSFDLAVPTHIHDDHTCGIPHLQRFYGTQCWALQQVGQLLADPASWASTPCLFPKPIHIDRWLADGECFQWQEYSFEIFHAPGQTEFHSILTATIDGRKTAFTGDNIFLEEVLSGGKIKIQPFQTTVLRNSFQLDMHRRCGEVMRKIYPELICPGHRDVFSCDKSTIDSYCAFIARKERSFRSIVAQPADHYIDLFWARLLPYITTTQAAEKITYNLLLRNNFNRKISFEARLLPLKGWGMSESFAEVTLVSGEQGEIKLLAQAPTEARVRQLLTAEIRIDGVSQGPVSEALVTVV